MRSSQRWRGCCCRQPKRTLRDSKLAAGKTHRSRSRSRVPSVSLVRRAYVKFELFISPFSYLGSCREYRAPELLPTLRRIIAEIVGYRRFSVLGPEVNKWSISI